MSSEYENINKPIDLVLKEKKYQKVMQNCDDISSSSMSDSINDPLFNETKCKSPSISSSESNFSYMYARSISSSSLKPIKANNKKDINKLIKLKKSHSLLDLRKKHSETQLSPNLNNINYTKMDCTNNICKYCKGAFVNHNFTGNFCSKSCVGKYAQIKSVRSRKLKKMRRNPIFNEVHSVTNGKNNLITHSKNINRSSINVLDINSNAVLNDDKNVELEKASLLKRKSNNLYVDNYLNANAKKLKNNVNDENEDSVVCRQKLSYIEDKNNLNSNNNAKNIYDSQENNVNLNLKQNSFNWNLYLNETNAKAAPECLFKNPFPVNENGFEMNMRLEGVDLKHPELICVLSVSKIQGYRIRLHFDGYDSAYDFWLNADSQKIFPVGFCKKNNLKLEIPLGYDANTFNYESYLRDKIAAPEYLFNQKRDNNENIYQNFEIGMKLEAVDKHNRSLIRVATVILVEKNRIKIHYDGWPNMYDRWFNKDSEDLHPVGWCERTGHPLEPPISKKIQQVISGCNIFGCNGYGHVRGYKFERHHRASGCPYAIQNINKDLIPDRLLEQPQAVNLNLINSEEINNKRELKNMRQNTKAQGLEVKQLKKPVINESVELKRKRGRPKKNSQPDIETKLKTVNLPKKQKRDPLTTFRKAFNTTLKDDVHETVCISSFKPYYNAPFHLQYKMPILPGSKKYTLAEVEVWKPHDVSVFIRSLPGCEQYAELFKTQQIDGQALLLMKQTDFVQMLQLKLGPAIKIYNSVLAFKHLDNKC